MFRGMVPIPHICERDKKRSLPSTPFLRAWAVRELDAKNRALRDPAVCPKFPLGKKTRARFQNRDFSDFCQFRSSENRVSEVFQARKRQNGKKMEIYASHTTHLQQARQRGAWRHSEAGGWGATRGRVRTHHAPRFQALTLFAEYPVQAGVRCGGEAACGAADRFRCAPGLARVCAGGHAVRAA